MKKMLYTAFLSFLMVQSVFSQEENNNNKAMSVQEDTSMISTGLDASKRQSVADVLNRLLSNEYVLYVKTQKFHWNVTGPFFGPLHELFGNQYEQLQKIIDMVAERVRALEFYALGTLSEFLDNATISESPGNNPDDKGMIKELLDGHEAIIRQLRDDIDLTVDVNDMGTNNFLSDLIEKHEKTAWMLRAHLK